MRTTETIILNSEHEYRGYLINEFTRLERALDKHLLLHFFPNNDANDTIHYRMHEVLLDRMTFDGKRTAVKGILDRKLQSEGFVKTKRNAFPHGKLLGNELRDLIEIRNHFAHYLTVVDSSENVITLLQFRDSTKIIRYSQKQFDELVVRIRKATRDILDLIPSTGAGL